MLATLILLCSGHMSEARSLQDPGTEAHVMRSEQELVRDLQILLKTFSFNIVNLEHGFQVSRGSRRAKFTAVKDLPYDVRRYVVSGPTLNGILELKLGDGFYYDVFFMEAAAGSVPSGRVVRIEKLAMRRR